MEDKTNDKTLTENELDDYVKTAFAVLLEPRGGTAWIVDDSQRLHGLGLEAATEILKARFLPNCYCRPFVLNPVIGALKDHEAYTKQLRERLEEVAVSLESWRNR